MMVLAIILDNLPHKIYNLLINNSFSVNQHQAYIFYSAHVHQQTLQKI